MVSAQRPWLAAPSSRACPLRRRRAVEAGMTVQVALVHLEQGEAVEGGFDVMAVRLTGGVGEAQASGHADAHET